MLELETASLSRIGNRTENQDRVAVHADEHAALAIVLDGMGGHADGARAAEVAIDGINELYAETPTPIEDPRAFLRDAIDAGHGAILKLDSELPLDARPRATCAMFLVQNGYAYWAHVGDSRIYLLRDREVARRTRDHSHIELLLREGLITEAEYRHHPMRNFVEFCLGGDPANPQRSIAGGIELESGDILLVCSDGLWSGADDATIAHALMPEEPDSNFDTLLQELVDAAVAECAPGSDNTTAAAVRIANPGR